MKTCKKCGKEFDEKYKQVCSDCRKEDDRLTLSKYNENKRKEFEERWKPRIKECLKNGIYNYREMGERFGVSRQMVHNATKRLGMEDEVRKIKEKKAKKWKCRVCGIEVKNKRAYCEKHRKYSDETYPCKMCGRETEPGNRSFGMCLNCYDKFRDAEQCAICEKRPKRVGSICIICYNRIKKRVVKGQRDLCTSKELPYYEELSSV